MEQTKEDVFKKVILSSSDMDIPDPKDVAERRVRVCIIQAQWHKVLLDSIRTKFETNLEKLGVDVTDIENIVCPGCWEIPYMAAKSIDSTLFDVIVCFGLLIKGDTMHFEMIANATNNELMRLQTEHLTPIVNSIFCCNDTTQAERRTTGDMSDDLANSLAATTVYMGLFKKGQPKRILKPSSCNEKRKEPQNYREPRNKSGFATFQISHD